MGDVPGPPAPAPPFAALDRSGEPWVGTLGTRGSLRVWADGTWEVDAADAETHEVLAHGWAVLLSHVRRGRRILSGTAMVPPDDARALLLSGGLDQQAEVSLLLAARGWRLLADTTTPADLTGPEPVVHPRGGPWLVPRHLALHSALLTDARVRPGATAQLVGAEPVREPVVLAAHVRVADTALGSGGAGAEFPHGVVPVTGARRMAPQFALLHDVVLAGIEDPLRVMADDMATSRIPLAELTWPGPVAGMDEVRARALAGLLDWWRETVG